MAELDPHVKHQIDAILKSEEESAIERWNELLKAVHSQETQLRSAMWLEIAVRFLAGLHKAPPCFHLHLYDELQNQLDPVLHIDPCIYWNEENDICELGLDRERCGECSSYEPNHIRIGSRIDCNDCTFKCEWNLR